MDRKLTIIIPHPPKACWPNARAHWGAISRAKRTLKQTTRLVAKSRWTQGEPMQKARVFVTWESATHQAPDPDNIIACLKGAFDGLEAAGIIENDRDLIPMPPTVRRKCPAPAVILDIEEIE